MFDNILNAKSGTRSTLPVDIRAEVYRLVLGEGKSKSQVIADFEERFPGQVTSGNLITIKASVDTVASVLRALDLHIPGALKALEALKTQAQAEPKTADTAKLIKRAK